MAKAQSNTSSGSLTTSGEQMDLIDVTPEELQNIRPVAKKYKQAQRARLAAEKDEVALKQELLTLIKAAKIKRLDDGSIKFSCDGLMVKVIPRDELVKVTGVEEDDEPEKTN